MLGVSAENCTGHYLSRKGGCIAQAEGSERLPRGAAAPLALEGEERCEQVQVKGKEKA